VPDRRRHGRRHRYDHWRPGGGLPEQRGYILAGPEFLTVFEGLTGKALATTDYIPARGKVSDWGDSYGNRVDRFLAGIGYVDGHRPSLIAARGYYTRTVLVAWDWRNGQLTARWVFDSRDGTPGNTLYEGQGNHNLSIADVDGDGKDEIVYGAMSVDDDGKGLYTTRLGHGDALHVSDMDPDRQGLEVFQPHESPSAYGPNGLEFRDARTGQLIWGVAPSPPGDIGRGLALDVDPRYRGYEMWGAGRTGGMYTAQLSTPDPTLGPRAIQISATKPSINFGVWWDADPLRELLDNVTISKWNWTTGAASALFAPTGVASNNGTKATPALSADILGDWREEVIWRASDNSALRIYTTTIPATTRVYTLMHDRQYREAIAWQNTAYNQPPHPSFFFGDGMAAPPRPNILYEPDTTPPVIESLTVSRPVLWPPNHRMIDISVIATVTDNIDPAPVTRIVSVTSNEPVSGIDEEDLFPDWEITGDMTLKLRAERASEGSGRIYTITVESRDAFGNTSTRTVEVSVPHNM
jgi:rhamnogalacturonan endolyase